MQHQPSPVGGADPGAGDRLGGRPSGGDAAGLAGDGGDRHGKRAAVPQRGQPPFCDGIDGDERAVGGEHDQADAPLGADRATASRRVARRRPSARVSATAATSAVSLSAKSGRWRPRRRVSAPHVVRSLTSAARSSSPSPCGRRSSRWRRLRSRSPPVVALRPAACCSARASVTNALTSVPDSSISAIRAIATAGSPFSTTSPVGMCVAGSIVSTQTPSKGTALTSARDAWSANSRTPRPWFTSRRWSRRTRSGAATAIARV